MATVDDFDLPGLDFAEQGDDPDTPASGVGRLFAKSDGLYFIDDAGTVVGPLGTGGGSGSGTDWSALLDTKSTADDPPDDEFDDTTGMSGTTNGLDSKWTVNSGADQAVDLLESSNVARYDLDTRPGWLLMQAGSSGAEEVGIYQDWTLGDGESIVAAVSAPPRIDDDMLYTNNERRTGLSLTSGGTSPDAAGSAPYVWIGAPEVDADQLAIRYMTHDGSSFDALGQVEFQDWGKIIYTRIARSGSTYHGFVSIDGSSWVPLGGRTLPSAPTRLWLFDKNGASHPSPVEVSAFHWVRKGTNGIDPW